MTPVLKRTRLVSLFSGIGAFEEGLKRAGVPYELICFGETDSASALSYSLLHDVPLSKNWKNVQYIDGNSLRNVDLLIHGASIHLNKDDFSPMWETIRVVEECRPKVVVWETLPDVVSKKNLGNFEIYLDTVGKAGYRSYFKIINSHNHRSAQKRRRMIVVSLREDVKGEFFFPEDEANPKKLSEYLEDGVGSDYTVPIHIVDAMVLGLITVNNQVFYNIKNATTQGYLEAQEGDGIDWSYPTSETRRGRVQFGACHTLTSSCALGTIQNKMPRFFTPKEYWRLQEFKDKQFDAITKYGVSNKQLYKQAANSTNINVAEALSRALSEQGFI